METNKILQGDCVEVMKSILDGSVDLIATDPPYGISFMGREWDKAIPSIDVWKECLRVLKPGAFAFVMSSARQDVLSRMMIKLEDAGFDTAFTSIYWTYASGFPKAMNMGKATDKKLGRERKVVGRNPNSRENCDKTNTLYESGTVGKTDFLTKGDSELEGSYAGFQPKPAVEVIIVAMKPIEEKTYLDQALKNGKGVTWFDDCRIPYKSEDDMIPQLAQDKREVNSREMYGGTSYNTSKTKAMIGGNKSGRFPANLLVSDDMLNDGTITKSTGGKSGHTGAYEGGWKDTYYQGANPGLGDSGSNSRYFSLDAWWEEQFKKLPEKVQNVFPFLMVPKASRREKNEGCEELELKQTGSFDGNADTKNTHRKIGGSPDKPNQPRQNFHPTVKPLTLMSYLITLGSRKGDVVLEPFSGSGTTCVAAEMLGRKWIGIELNPEYITIAEARLNTLNKAKQGELFE